MSVKKYTYHGTKPSAAKSHPIAAAIGTLVLLAIGAVSFLFGKRAIVSEYFEYENRGGSNVTIGSLGFDDRAGGFRILEGPEAVYWGVAFCALGVMFGLWGFGLALWNLSRKKEPAEPSRLGRANTWLSFICLLVAILCLFPPWRLGSAIFYIVSFLAVAGFVFADQGKRRHLPKQVLGGLILAAILAGNMNLTPVCVDILVAMGAMLFVSIHVLSLAPHLMKAEIGEKEAEPSGGGEE